jgi:hypothetical protein
LGLWRIHDCCYSKNFPAFIAVALFSGLGLLLSLAVSILDQYSPVEWF